MNLINRCLLASCILVLFFVVSVRAQSISSKPVISYQGMIANADGSQADSGTYRVAVSMWTAEFGGEQIWSDEFVTNVARGVFNIQLGSAKPLPSATVMDKPLWISISINGAPSALRAQLSAVPMAMNVADSAITSAKMATDYVSSISVNGQKVTGQASNLNIIGGDGINLAYDNSSNSLVLNTSGSAMNTDGKGAKVENATTGDWTVGGDDLSSILWPASIQPYLGTLNTSGPKPIDWQTIVGAERATYYHYVSGGTPDIAEGDATNVANNNVLGGSSIGGGANNTIHSAMTSLGGGDWNRIDTLANFSFIGGGDSNHVDTSSEYAVIGGGDSNIVLGNFGTVGGGNGNYAYGGATIGGGNRNTASDGGTIAGGTNNGAGPGGTVGGGGPNIAGEASTVGGGVLNQALGGYATVGGGQGNTAQPSISHPMTYPGLYNTIAGGYANTISGTAGAIPGGDGMSIGSYSFAFNGDSLLLAGGPGAGYTDLTTVTGIAYFGDVNLMIGNVDSVARQLRFYGPNSDHTYGSGAKFTSFRAPLMDSDVFYVLPKAQGDTNTVLTEDGHGNLSWASQLGALDWSITGNYGTHAPTNFIGTLDSQAFEIHVFDTAAATGGNKRVMHYEPGTYSPNIVGGSSANSIDTGLSGAVILSGGSLEEPNYISANFSVISGGYNNMIDSGAYISAIGGGANNTVESFNSIVGGGNNNTIEKYSDYSVIAGGRLNTIHDTSLVFPTQAVIGGGLNNLIFNCIATIAGGNDNSIYSGFSSIGGGSYVTISSNSPYGTIAGGVANTIGSNSDHATIGGGGFNTIGANANYATIAGGDTNKIGPNSDHATIAGGGPNTVNSPFSAIGGGSINTIDTASDHGTIAGGDSNTITSNASFASILGGKNNLIQDSGSVITGGKNNSIEFTNSNRPSENGFIGAGAQNRIDGSGVDTTQEQYANNSAIAGGHNNAVHSGNSFIGAGDSNITMETKDFIGAGDQNSVNANESGIITGQLNAISLGAYWSIICAGFQNIIEVNADKSFIGTGSQNEIFGTNSFIGTGSDNNIFAGSSVIIAGASNTIGPDANNSFVGAGGGNSALAAYSFIGTGTDNITDTGVSSAGGEYASIPGGEGLISQSYAQTVLGFYNNPGGLTTNADTANTPARHNDPLIIAGNGTAANRKNAWLITNGGTSVVYDIHGSSDSGASRSGTTLDPIYGGRSQDNTTSAWGDIPAGTEDTVSEWIGTNADFGVASNHGVKHWAAGVYVIQIILNINHASILVTPQYNADEDTLTGANITATCSQMGVAGANTFIVRTYLNGTPHDEPFFFQLEGRQ